MCGGGKGGTDNSAQQAADAEAQRQKQVMAGTHRVNNTFDAQFTPAYYAKISQGYLDYADPQLDTQYQNTQRNLAFSLARDGNLNSSTSADQQAGLLGQYNANKLQIANQSQDQAEQARAAVEQARSGLITSLNAGGNAAGTANLASGQAAALAAPPSYSALGDLFSTTTTALASQAAAERAQALSGIYGGGYKAPINTGLFK